MAKVLGPLHSDHVKGSFSGLTYREYRGLATTTRRPRPVRRISRPLSDVRSILAYLCRSWNNLDISQQAAWKAYAQNHPTPNGFGGSFMLDGNQMFIKLNALAIRLFSLSVFYDMPPIDDSPAVVDTLVASAGAASGEIKLDWTHLGIPAADDANEIQLTRYFDSSGRAAVESAFRFHSTTSGNIITSTISDLVPDGWYWARVRYVTQRGQVTNFVWSQAQAKVVIP